LAATILLFIQARFNKKSAQTGFIFLGGSGLKFLVFFLVFYPYYRQDGVMATSEFAAFFIPYATCLILEVIFLSKQLNNQDS
jgi:F0F1-type ATP synthase assembly protein I